VTVKKTINKNCSIKKGKKVAYDFLSREGEMTVNELGWAMIRTVAEFHGWEPMGTRVPDPAIWPEKFTERAPKSPQGWGGHYDSNDFQEVAGEDSFNMRKALMAGAEAIRNGDHDSDLLELLFPGGIREYVDYFPTLTELKEDIVELIESFTQFSKGTPFLIA
jgi:hypothetical protein